MMNVFHVLKMRIVSCVIHLQLKLTGNVVPVLMVIILIQQEKKLIVIHVQILLIVKNVHQNKKYVQFVLINMFQVMMEVNVKNVQKQHLNIRKLNVINVHQLFQIL